jgi:hypothetical protein
MKQNPWIGEAYSLSRLLILGESAYSWIEDGELRHPSKNHPTEIVRWAIEDFENMGRAAFLKSVTRALANRDGPIRAERKKAWNSCAFTNYVAGTVGKGARKRPSKKALTGARKPFLNLIETIKPQRIIVLGKDMWRSMPACAIYVTDDLQAYKLRNGALAWSLCVSHPAGRGSLDWASLSKVIRLFKSLNLPVYEANYEAL